MKKTLLASAIVALGLAASGNASAIIVGGVDFGSSGFHIETTTLAETYVDSDDDVLLGYGQVNTVNGNLLYAGADRLYFTFSYDVLSFSSTNATFENGTVNVYLMPTFNLLNQSSTANLTTITTTGTLWATFSGHNIAGTSSELNSTGILTGAGLAFTGAGLLDVTGGLADVFAFLNANTISDGVGGFADVEITTSGSATALNTFDDTTGCTDGTASAGQWCLAGSADLRGSVVPEPGTLALLGLGLMGLGASYRRKTKEA